MLVKRGTTIVAGLIFLFTALHAGEVTIDWKETHQTIKGFGGTMGWIHPHPDNRKEIFDLLFEDLGASVLRIRALGDERGDEFSAEQRNDNDDPTVMDLPKFGFDRSEADNAIIIKAAQDRGVELVLPTTWSPPAWMKTTGKRAGGGQLKEKYVEEYAELWAAYVLAMKKYYKIDIPYISIQNEPDIEYIYPTCGIPPKLYAKTLKAVQNRLDKEGLLTKALGPDTCRIFNMPEYLATMEHTADYGKDLPVLTHLYDYYIPFGRVDKDALRWMVARIFADKLERPLWLIETANYMSNTKPATYEEALIWARKMHHALVDGNCEVVCYWSLYFDKPAEALIYAKTSHARTYEITPKYYTSKNYFRFVRPGMKRCEADTDAKLVYVSAFRDPQQKVIVLVNYSRRAKRMQIKALDQLAWTSYTTTTRLKCEKAEGEGTKLRLPGRSITTIVVPVGGKNAAE